MSDGGTALARAIARYRAAPLADRLFIRGRAVLADLAAVEERLPREGPILDLGCGRGLLANLLLEASARREVLGIDPDPRRIAVARLTERPGLSFRVGDARHEDLPPCDAAVLMDVLYLLREEDQLQVLARAGAALRPGGRLVVHAQERRADPRFWLGRFQELAMTRTGITQAPSGGLRYSTRHVMRSRLESIGLAVEVIPLPGRLYTDAIYVGVKPLS